MTQETLEIQGKQLKKRISMKKVKSRVEEHAFNYSNETNCLTSYGLEIVVSITIGKFEQKNMHG